MEAKLEHLWKIAKDIYVEEGDDEVNTFEEFIRLLDEGKTLVVSGDDETYLKLIKRNDDDIDVEKYSLYCWRWVRDDFKLSGMNFGNQ
jgi:hypothetical protein